MAKELACIFGNDEQISSSQISKTVANSKPTQTIKEVEYKLSDLAKLDEKSNLGLKLLKPRDSNAARGSKFEILLVNKTNLILRREWVNKSHLLVIIPEKLIYKIFNEQTGECIYSPERAFMDEISPVYLDDNNRFLGNKINERLIDLEYVSREFTEEELACIGQKPNDTNFSKFFQNINHGDLVSKINDSELLWGNELFKRVDYNTNTYPWTTNYKYSPLELDKVLRFGSLKERQLTCLYYKSPVILTNEIIRKSFTFNNYGVKRLSLDSMKVALKLLQEFPEYTQHVNRLVAVWENLSWWPDERPITDINILRRLFRNIYLPPDRWQRDAENELKNAIYTYAYGVNEWDKYRTYLKEIEYVTLNQAHYFDMLKKAKALNNGKLKEKYPTHWLTWENKVNRIYAEHRRFIEAQRKFTYNDIIEKLEHITAEDNKDYDYIIKLPRTYGEILEEGEKMNHCVGGYADGIYRGDRIVLFLRKKNKPDKPYGTIDVIWEDKDKLSTYRIHQMKGQANTSLPIEVISYIAKYIKLKGLLGIDEFYAKQAINNGDVATYDLEQERLKEEAKKAKTE